MAFEALLCLTALGTLALLPFLCLASVEPWGLVACTGAACGSLVINGRLSLCHSGTEMSNLLGAGVSRELNPGP